MKKLQVISEKIEKTNNNYFGRGSFEAIIKENKHAVLSWLEDLTPVQEQIRRLEDEYHCENLQKRNYVRIITKIFPQEYNQFVCVNILLRDIDSITLAFDKVNELKTQYAILVDNKKLKFPGKHQKYVDFETYQQFITLYRHDLINKSMEFETDEALDFSMQGEGTHTSVIQEIVEPVDKAEVVDSVSVFEGKPLEMPLQTQKELKTEENKIKKVEEEIVEEKLSNVVKEEIQETPPDKNENKNEGKNKTNWMNVLLKGI